jgi:beta-galactosidase
LAEVGDTFLEFRNLGHGVLWVNGHNLGRYWNIGPQQTLYCPGVWLKKGKNEIIALECLESEKMEMQGLKTPVMNELHLEKDFSDYKQPN